MTDVHQCPFCELRFMERWEIKAHLADDHPGRIKEKDKHVRVEEPDVDNPKPL